MKPSIFLAIISIICASCSSSYRDTTLYHTSGNAKPIVAVLPVIDNTGINNVSWDISQELTHRIQKRIFDSSKLYLLKEKGDLEMAQLLNSPDPSTIPSNTGRALGAAEYAIVTELLNRDEVCFSHPKASNERSFLQEVGGNIHLAIRVRVIDLRNDKPKVILQEVINEDHEISRAYMNVDYSKNPWGNESYERSPLGIAHCKIVRDLVAHAEGYIGANRR